VQPAREIAVQKERKCRRQFKQNGRPGEPKGLGIFPTQPGRSNLLASPSLLNRGLHCVYESLLDGLTGERCYRGSTSTFRRLRIALVAYPSLLGAI
jgi:hypothetical protein